MMHNQAVGSLHSTDEALFDVSQTITGPLELFSRVEELTVVKSKRNLGLANMLKSGRPARCSNFSNTHSMPLKIL